jgi:hypothetical protein
MQDGLKGDEYNFAEVVRLARGQCEGQFWEGAGEAVVVKAGEVEESGAEWSWGEEIGLLREEIGVIADLCRRDETKKMVNCIEVHSDLFVLSSFNVRGRVELELICGLQRNFKKQIVEPVELALNKASLDMWDQVLATFKKTLDKAESTYLTKAKSMSTLS